MIGCIECSLGRGFVAGCPVKRNVSWRIRPNLLCIWAQRIVDLHNRIKGTVININQFGGVLCLEKSICDDKCYWLAGIADPATG